MAKVVIRDENGNIVKRIDSSELEIVYQSEIGALESGITRSTKIKKHITVKPYRIP